MADDFKAFARKVEEFYKVGLDDAAIKKVVDQVGAKAKVIAAERVASDLGGDGFSGWKAPLSTAFEHTKPGAIRFGASGRGKGPWQVAEAGRHHGGGGGFQGPGVNRKTGVTARTKSGGLRKVSGSRGKRWNGYTHPFNTWTETEKTLEPIVPLLVQEHIAKAMHQAFKG